MQLKLYLIEILHQTTTFMLITMLVPELYLIEILHQTTTRCAVADHFVELYLIEILHQTTTARRRSASNAGCILSKFYIKPQQLTPYRQPGEVVSYRNSTSNHNRAFRRIDEKRLYLIEILHQTTTEAWEEVKRGQLYLIEILHQTTTFAVHLQTFVELYLIEILHQTTTFCSMISVP